MNGKYPPSLTLPERYSIDVLYVNQSALVFPEIVTSSPKRFASSSLSEKFDELSFEYFQN